MSRSRCRWLSIFSAGGRPSPSSFFFFNDTATTEIYTLSLHDALPISGHAICPTGGHLDPSEQSHLAPHLMPLSVEEGIADGVHEVRRAVRYQIKHGAQLIDRKSTRLNSSHDQISYAVFCLKKKKKTSVRIPFYQRRHFAHTYRAGIQTHFSDNSHYPDLPRMDVAFSLSAVASEMWHSAHRLTAVHSMYHTVVQYCDDTQHRYSATTLFAGFFDALRTCMSSWTPLSLWRHGPTLLRYFFFFF